MENIDREPERLANGAELAQARRYQNPQKHVGRSYSRSALGSVSKLGGALTGMLRGGLSIFFAIFLITLLTRAYSGYGYISFKTVLDVFSNTSSSDSNTWSSWMSVASDWLNIASAKVSLSTYVHPGSDILKALVSIFDVIVDIPNTLILITQGIVTILNFFGQAVYMIGSTLLGISKLTSSGTFLEDGLSEAREAVWNSWIS